MRRSQNLAPSEIARLVRLIKFAKHLNEDQLAHQIGLSSGKRLSDALRGISSDKDTERCVQTLPNVFQNCFPQLLGKGLTYAPVELVYPLNGSAFPAEQAFANLYYAIDCVTSHDTPCPPCFELRVRWSLLRKGTPGLWFADDCDSPKTVFCLLNPGSAPTISSLLDVLRSLRDVFAGCPIALPIPRTSIFRASEAQDMTQYIHPLPPRPPSQDLGTWAPYVLQDIERGLRVKLDTLGQHFERKPSTIDRWIHLIYAPSSPAQREKVACLCESSLPLLRTKCLPFHRMSAVPDVMGTPQHIDQNEARAELVRHLEAIEDEFPPPTDLHGFDLHIQQTPLPSNVQLAAFKSPGKRLSTLVVLLVRDTIAFTVALLEAITFLIQFLEAQSSIGAPSRLPQTRIFPNSI